ncbi:MAG: histidine triad nucleotide-binding protein [Alphaproteobacteria bacterium]|nr:histidine triad nucleotide-binding protein [Alphaproteobacteria bacterium]
MTYDEDNIFAKILRGEIPCRKLYDDAFAIAFEDIAPKAPVHILVIPKGKYTDVEDFGVNANAAEITGFWRAVARITQDRELCGPGFRVIANCGANGGQEVPHFHAHILAGKPLGPLVAGK